MLWHVCMNGTRLEQNGCQRCCVRCLEWRRWSVVVCLFPTTSKYSKHLRKHSMLYYSFFTVYNTPYIYCIYCILLYPTKIYSWKTDNKTKSLAKSRSSYFYITIHLAKISSPYFNRLAKSNFDRYTTATSPPAARTTELTPPSLLAKAYNHIIGRW